MRGNVAQSLRVPLNSEEERLPGVFDGLDGSIRRPGAGALAGAQAVDSLVVERVDVQLRRSKHSSQRASGRDHDRVSRYAAVGDLAMGDRVANDVRQVLMQSAAAHDIERLSTPADAQGWQSEPHRFSRDRILEAIKVRLGRAQLDMRPRAIRRRREVWPSREHETVETSEQAPSVLVTDRRHDHRNPARGLDRPHIGHPERHLGVRGLAVPLKRAQLSWA
jgi:hypothetical protein